MGTHRFSIEGMEYEVHVGHRTGDRVRVSVNGKAYDVDIVGEESTAERSELARAAAAAAARSGVPGGGQVRAPISGVVLRIEVEPGQKVVRGTVLLILEAMKMENEIFAAEDGIVQSLGVKPLQEVREGDVLVVIIPG
ncbi:MAG: biotin/lipoyl-binding protein [Deltaproteobacteria bacterium]|nr:biotin/lipoyl-binding protein [Deltaproteobacteria bacterium]